MIEMLFGCWMELVKMHIFLLFKKVRKSLIHLINEERKTAAPTCLNEISVRGDLIQVSKNQYSSEKKTFRRCISSKKKRIILSQELDGDDEYAENLVVDIDKTCVSISVFLWTDGSEICTTAYAPG